MNIDFKKIIRSNLSSLLIGVFMLGGLALAATSGYAILDENGVTESPIYEKTVVIRDESDFPPIDVNNRHPLAEGVQYVIDGRVDIANTLLLPTGSSGISSTGPTNRLKKTGGGTMIFNDNHGGGDLVIGNVSLDGDGTATLFDITETGNPVEIVATTGNVTNFASLGTLDVSSVALKFITFSYNDPLDTTIASDFYSEGSIFFSNDGDSDGLILRMGANTIAQIIANTPFMQVGEEFLNIPSTANDFVMEVSGNLIAPGGGELFHPTGLNQDDPRIDSKGNIGFPDSSVIGSYIWSGNSTETLITDQGLDNTIVSFTDAGGGLVTVTTGTSHGLTTGDDVSISGLSGYDGYYTIANAVGSTFDITSPFNGAGTGFLTSGWVKLAGVTYEGDVHRSSMSGNNQLTFTNLSEESGKVIMSLTVERGGGSGAPTMQIAVFENGAPVLIGGREVIDKVDTTTGVPRPANLVAPVVINENDIYELYGRNITNTSNILPTDGQLIID